jgi:hypothetical protein
MIAEDLGVNRGAVSRARQRAADAAPDDTPTIDNPPRGELFDDQCLAIAMTLRIAATNETPSAPYAIQVAGCTIFDHLAWPFAVNGQPLPCDPWLKFGGAQMNLKLSAFIAAASICPVPFLPESARASSIALPDAYADFVLTLNYTNQAFLNNPLLTPSASATLGSGSNTAIGTASLTPSPMITGTASVSARADSLNLTQPSVTGSRPLVRQLKVRTWFSERARFCREEA